MYGYNNEGSVQESGTGSVQEGVGDGESWHLLGKEGRAKVWDNLEKGAKIMQDQIVQVNWGKIRKSNYYKVFKE